MGQLRLGGRDVAVALEVGQALLLPPLLHVLAQQLDRVDACEHPPGGVIAGELHKGVVEQVCHGVLLQGRGAGLPGEGALPVGNRYLIGIRARAALYDGPGPGALPRAGGAGLVPGLHFYRAVGEEQPAQIFTFIAVGRTAEE